VAATAYFAAGPAGRFALPRNGKNAAETPSTAGALPILPPGAGSAAHYAPRCVACQACTAACPAGIIRSKSSHHPELVFDKGYCHFNCTACGDVCPTGAIRKLGEAKQRTRVALVGLALERCVVITDRRACGACAEVCPTHAIYMPPYEEAGGLPAPLFDADYCIGCGACRHACPIQDEPRVFTLSGVTTQILTPGLRPADEPDAPLPGMADEFPF